MSEAAGDAETTRAVTRRAETAFKNIFDLREANAAGRGGFLGFIPAQKLSRGNG